VARRRGAAGAVSIIVIPVRSAVACKLVVKIQFDEKRKHTNDELG
jgi:hypothetical protein